MYKMQEFISGSSGESIDSPQSIPKELDIFSRTEEQFLPSGKKFEDLTEEELRILKNKYRYDVYKPGIYQCITGFGHML